MVLSNFIEVKPKKETEPQVDYQPFALHHYFRATRRQCSIGRKTKSSSTCFQLKKKK